LYTFVDFKFEPYQLPCAVLVWLVEQPNVNFLPMLEKSAAEAKIPFPMRIVQNSAESMIDIADASVDTVISTHVLCSVPDADKVLGEIKRVLKPGMIDTA